MKRMLYFILIVLGVVALLFTLKPLLPDWLRIVLNSKPQNLPEAIKLAKDTYKYDKE